MTNATKLRAVLAAAVLGIAATASASDVSYDQAQLRAARAAKAPPVLMAAADAMPCECHPKGKSHAGPGAMRTGHQHAHPSPGSSERPTTGVHRR